MIELLLAAENALALGLLDQAERTYRQVLESDPRNGIAAVGLARVALERGDETGAIRLARDALEIDPENATARRMIDRLEEVVRFRGEGAGPAGGVAGPGGDAEPRGEVAGLADGAGSGGAAPSDGMIRASGAPAEPWEAQPSGNDDPPTARSLGHGAGGGPQAAGVPGVATADAPPAGPTPETFRQPERSPAEPPIGEAPPAEPPPAEPPPAEPPPATPRPAEPPPATSPTTPQPSPTPARSGLLRRLLRRP